MQHKQVERRPVVTIRGKDIAPYLYGRALRILVPDGKESWEEDLLAIRKAVSQSSDGTLFGVQLRPICNEHDLHPGDKLLCLSSSVGGALKSIIRITSIERDRDSKTTVVTTTLWPETSQGWEGFFPAEEVTALNKAERPILHPVLYLHYEGELPETGPERHKSFYERMLEYADDLNVLIECWAIAMDPELRNQNIWSHDPYVTRWRTKFAQRHGQRFQHELVWHQLEYLSFDGSLTGINRIFDDRRGHNLITPLLFQMQTDILERLYEDESFVDLIFSPENGEHWLRHLQVLFERYYGPKYLISQPKITKDPRPESTIDFAQEKKLRLIEALINRGATEGEREAARCAWERIAGRPYETDSNHRPFNEPFVI